MATDSKGEMTRKYRACKFCGFWQEAAGEVWKERGGKPYRCVHIACKMCGIFDWKVPWGKDFGKCPKCSKEFQKIDWAVDNPSHYFNDFIKEMDKIHQSLGLSRIPTQ